MSKLLKRKTTQVEIGRATVRTVKMDKNAKEIVEKPAKKRWAFALCPRFFLFVILWYAARLFTQALRSPLSSILYVFLFLLPLFCLAYVLISRATIQVYLGSGHGEGQKRTPIDFDMRIINDSPLPLNFVEADLLVPDDNRVRCRAKRVQMILLPHGAVDLAQSLVFPYRGEYEIGISDVYVYDFFRMFRVRKRLETYMRVYILPRKVRLEEDRRFSVSDVDSENQKNRFGSDRAEVNDLRTYIPGDHMKSIHWKLSSKSEELMVKEYSHHAGNTVYLFADMAQIHSGRYAVNEEVIYEDDVNEFVADGVVEAATALVDCALRNNHRCEILWYDSRAKGGICRYELEQQGQEERFFRPLATADIMPKSCEVTKLAELVSQTQGASYVFVSGNLDDALAKGVSDLAALAGSENVSLYFVTPESRIASPEQKQIYLRRIRRNSLYLQSRGIYLTDPRRLGQEIVVDVEENEPNEEKGEGNESNG